MAGERRSDGAGRLGVRRGWWLGCLLALTGCAAGPQVPEGEQALPTASFSFPEAPVDLFDAYRIGPGDRLEVVYSVRDTRTEGRFAVGVGDTVSVKFLNAQEYNETQRVRPDGRISLPYIGIVEAAGKSVEELTADLERRYREVFREPELLVTVPEYYARLEALKEDLQSAGRGGARLVSVRPDGYVTLPIVGDVAVAGRTLNEVDRLLADAYRQLEPGLEVDVLLEQHAVARIYVLGQVDRPGAYEVTRPLSVVEAISLAQGHTPAADLAKVVVFGRRGEQVVGRQVDVKDMLALRAGSAFHYLGRDDIVYVPERGLSVAARTTQEVLNVLMFRGWGASYSFGNDNDNN